MTQEITLHPDAGAGDGKSYAVHVDGTRVGRVYQGMVTHDRKPRGSRIVTSRSHSPRWFASPGGGYGWEDTRREAIARVLAQHLGGTIGTHEDLARTARVIRPVEADKTVEMLALAAERLNSAARSFTLRFGDGTWEAVVVTDGRLTESEGATPTEAMAGVFRALGWMD